MKNLIILLLAFFLCLQGFSTIVWAERVLKGEVLLVGPSGDQDTEPANLVTVSLPKEKKSTVTDDLGQFTINLPPSLTFGKTLILRVQQKINGKSWRMWNPINGEIPLARSLFITIKLLPKGSKKFWTDEFIEYHIAKMAEDAKREVTSAKPTEVKKQVDLGPLIKEWAQDYGFTAQDVKRQIDQWVVGVEEKQEDFYKLGLAAYAKKHFARAAELFEEDATINAKQFKLHEQKAEGFREKAMRGYRKAGDSHSSNYEFTKALTAYNHALNFVEKSENLELWAEVQMDIAGANWAIGIRTEGSVVHEHLNRAKEAYVEAAKGYKELGDTTSRAAAQGGLGIALSNQGIRTGGEEGRQLLAEAVAAYRAALEVYTRAQLPQDWAMTQNNLGATLRDQGIRTGGEEGRQLLAEAVAAYRAALEVRTRAQLPQDWAMTQNNLGLTLGDQGIRTGGEEGRQLLAEAVAAYRAALEVYTRAQLPQDWAMTQNNLGATLRDQGIRTGGEEGRQLLAEAVAAYRAALVVRAKESLAPQWAQTHNNLAEAAMALGDWEQVVTSYGYVLELYPDYQDAYLNTNSVLHEQLFRFTEAFALNEAWLQTHPNDESAQMNFAEVHLTTGRFGEAVQRLSNLLGQPDLDPQVMIPLSLLRIVAVIGQQQDDQVPEYLKGLHTSLAAQPEEFTLGWSFEGTKHFISQDEAFHSSREWLLTVLTDFSGTPRDTMLAAVETAQSKFVAADSPSGIPNLVTSPSP